jgi:2,4-dichlorophenol 6-monooxygenase
MEGHRDVLGSEAPVTPATELDAEVVVVGTGPTGAAAALALSTYGINVLLVTQHGHLSDTPRAHITNQRTMEVLRDLGVADEVARYATPWEAMGDTLFTTSLAGPEIARIRAWGTGEDRIADYLRTSPCTPLDVSQPDMESVLVRHATTRGATLRFATRYLGHEQDDDGVSVRLEDRHLGHVYTVRCRYLIGADGARSKIAEDLGLVIEGTMARAATVYVHFEADLRRYVEHRRSVLYWILSEGAAHGEIGMGLLRAVRPWTRWIAGWGHDMSTGEPDLSEHTIRERVQGLIGDPEPEIRIERSTTWFVNEAYATTYARGRVLCAGDAVHRHPPSNGLGSNTGIQDAYNLAWTSVHPSAGRSWSGPTSPGWTLARFNPSSAALARTTPSQTHSPGSASPVPTASPCEPASSGLSRSRTTSSTLSASRRTTATSRRPSWVTLTDRPRGGWRTASSTRSPPRGQGRRFRTHGSSTHTGRGSRRSTSPGRACSPC